MSSQPRLRNVEELSLFEVFLNEEKTVSHVLPLSPLVCHGAMEWFRLGI